MYTLFGFPKTRSVRVAWILEELGLDYRYHLVNLKAAEHRQPEFLAISPAGKIPVLQTDEGVLAESAAIVTYLADKHAQGALIPVPGTYARGLFEQAMYFITCELEQPLWSKAKHDFALPEDYRLTDMQLTADYEFNRAISTFASMLGAKPFLLGDNFGAADVIAGHTLAWAKGAGLELMHDNVVDYAQRVLGRESYRRAWQNENKHLELVMS